MIARILQHRRRDTILILLTLLAISSFAACSQYLDRASTDAVDNAIQNNPKMSDLNKVCSVIPIPSSFRFVSKTDLDDQKTTFSINYYSDANLNEAVGLWREYFRSKGWDEVRSEISATKSVLEYSNSKYRVVLYIGGLGYRISHSIYCESL